MGEGGGGGQLKQSYKIILKCWKPTAFRKLVYMLLPIGWLFMVTFRTNVVQCVVFCHALPRNPALPSERTGV